MFDERLRELERRWRESGEPHDEARWLTERVRLGELAADRLELATYLGYPGAPQAEGGVEPDLVRLVDGLTRWGREAVVRAAVAAARSAQSLWPTDDYPMRRAVDTAAAWCLSQSEANARVCREAADHLGQWTRRQDWWGRMHTEAARAAQEAAEAAAWSPQQLTQMIEKWDVDPEYRDRDRFQWSTRVSLEAARNAASHAASALSHAVGTHVMSGVHDRVRLAIRDGLVPWALHYHDPLKSVEDGFDPMRPIRSPDPPRQDGGWPL